MVIYVAKLDATAPDEALKGTIDYVARIAKAMNDEAESQKRKTSPQPKRWQAGWLSKESRGL